MRSLIDSDGIMRRHIFMKIRLREDLVKLVAFTINCIKRMLSIWHSVLSSGSRKYCSSQSERLHSLRGLI